MLENFDHTVLRSARVMRSLRQAELAERVGCEERYLRALERGEKTNPSFLLVYRICAVLDIPMTALVKTTQETQTPYAHTPAAFQGYAPGTPLNTAGGRRGSFPSGLLRFPPAFAGFPAPSALQAVSLRSQICRYS